MFKKFKKELMISSLITLLPILIGLVLWNKLPNQMATHWGVNNQPDGWARKGVAVFCLPLILVAVQWLGMWVSTLDSQMQKQNKKALRMIFWIIPCISIFASCMMYSVALGHSVSITSAPCILLGLMFVLIGNYLPKTTKNWSLGIKVIWALNDEENWNATHRFAGKLWFFGGLAMMLGIFLPGEYSIFVMLPITLILAIIPAFYSYLYYKKQTKEGRGYALENPYKTSKGKKAYNTSMIALVLILTGVVTILFIGDINCVFHDESFTVEASFHDDLTVEYDVIDSIEIRYESIPGTREWGFGSAKLLLGTFHNEEFGMYTRYTYTNSDAAIIVISGDKILVFSGDNVEETEAIYEMLLTETGLGG